MPKRKARALKQNQSKDFAHIISNSQLKTTSTPQQPKSVVSNDHGVVTFGVALKDDSESLTTFLQSK